MYDDDRPVARLEPAQLSVSAPLSLPGSASMARSMKARRHGALPAYRALSYPLYSFILYTHTHSEDTFQPPQSRLYRSITSLAGCLLGSILLSQQEFYGNINNCHIYYADYKIFHLYIRRNSILYNYENCWIVKRYGTNAQKIILTCADDT